MDPLFPCAAGKQPVILFIKVDARRFAIAELRQHRVDTVNTHHISDLIEKGIRRFLNRFSDIQHTVSGFFFQSR